MSSPNNPASAVGPAMDQREVTAVCPVCLEQPPKVQLHIPRYCNGVVVCSHAHCTDCLREMYVRGIHSCSLCRKEIGFFCGWFLFPKNSCDACGSRGIDGPFEYSWLDPRKGCHHYCCEECWDRAERTDRTCPVCAKDLAEWFEGRVEDDESDVEESESSSNDALNASSDEDQP
jgi:hypothetical protein